MKRKEMIKQGVSKTRGPLQGSRAIAGVRPCFLCLETPEGNLVEGMSWLQGTFGNRFSRIVGGHGHVFQRRYKALLLEQAEWKVVVAMVFKQETSATNVWIAKHLNMGVSQAVSRYISIYRASKNEYEFRDLITRITE